MTSGISGDLAARNRGGSRGIAKSAAFADAIRYIFANRSAIHCKGISAIDATAISVATIIARRVFADRAAVHRKGISAIDAAAGPTCRVLADRPAVHRGSAVCNKDATAEMCPRVFADRSVVHRKATIIDMDATTAPAR